VRDYIHITDLAKGHIAAIRYLNGSSGAEIFNLGTGIGYSVLEVVNAFEEASGKEIPYEIVERRAGDVGSCYADPSKANQMLGWHAEKSLMEMCKDSWRWEEKTMEENI